MDHVLDNPAWNALNSGNKELAFGNDKVKFFDKAVSPFIGLKHNTPEFFQTLYDLATHNGPFGFISAKETAIPRYWTVLQSIKTFQMIYDGSMPIYQPAVQLVDLTAAHVPQMLALTKLTNPGPFAEKTISFGHYKGVFEDDQLVAMTGQRMHIYNYAEISAVCTHSGYLGRGYAKQLLLSHISRIKAAAETPILHVRTNNERAIKVYESVGFKTRRVIYFYIIKKSL